MRTIWSHLGRFIIICLFMGITGILGGCSANPLSGMHHDGVESNASVLTADGQAALDRGDYDHAVAYFKLAIQHDPRNSAARVGYAEAELKRLHFNLVDFFNSIATSTNNSGGSAPQTADLLQPQDWGCADMAALTTLLSTLIAVLDPIAMGQTDGPVARGDVTLNLNVGLFYMLRMAARVQEMSATITVQKYTKGTPEAAALGIPAAVYDLLPNDFYWVGNATQTQLLQVQADTDAGIARLQTAANNTTEGARKQLLDLINLFQSLQTQTHL
jgi:hypothetical protein